MKNMILTVNMIFRHQLRIANETFELELIQTVYRPAGYFDINLPGGKHLNIPALLFLFVTVRYVMLTSLYKDSPDKNIRTP